MAVVVSNETDVVVDEAALGELARHVLVAMGVDPGVELGITLVGMEEMTELHVQWMDEPGPTDVMAFPMDEPGAPEGSGPALLGDVVLCPAVAANQAVAAGHGLADELALLTTHGVLHLLGYDHAEPAEQRAHRPARQEASSSS